MVRNDNSDIMDIQYLNNKCKLLLTQIEELKNDYQRLILNKGNKQYTFIDGGKLVFVVPYKTIHSNNVHKCKSICEKDRDCYGFNINDKYSFFNKERVKCDFINRDDNMKKAGLRLNKDDTSLYIKINDENIKTTKRLLDKLIDEFHFTCNRNMEVLEHFTGKIISKDNVKDMQASMDTNDNRMFKLKDEITEQREKLGNIINEISYIEQDYNNSSLIMTNRNIILSIYTIIAIVLLIVIFKNNIII
jgi:hypothetical protein